MAANHSLDEICRYLNADSLAYLSLDALHRAVADDNNEYCYACYTGNYPTELVNIEELISTRQKKH